MVDYYAELNIDSSLSVDEINKELSRLENAWRRRELNSPEKATKILSLIIDAREVFKTVVSKANYDRELARSKNPSASNSSNKQQQANLQNWIKDANMYYDLKEYDLAKIAVDRALLIVSNRSDDELYNLAASIYMEIGELDRAMTFINHAIVMNDQDGLHYVVKAGIYGRYAVAAGYSNAYMSAQYYEEKRKTLQIGMDIADSIHDSFAKGCLLGAMACSLYFEPNPDQARAEAMAQEALALGENIGNAQKVLDAVNEQKERDEQAAREQQKKEEAEAFLREQQLKEETYREALKIAESIEISEKQRAIARLETIIDYKDTKAQIKIIKERIRQIEDRKKAEEDRKKRFKKRILAAIWVLVIIVLFKIIISQVIVPALTYRQAKDMFNKGEYESAISMFYSLNGFKDSNNYITMAYYEEAEKLFQNSNYSKAATIYKSISSFKDSESRLNEIYNIGNEFYDNGNTQDAVDVFEALNGYKDAGEKATYLNAEQLYNDGHVAAAAVKFNQINTSESREKSQELWNKVIKSRRKSVVVNNEHSTGSYIFGITTAGNVVVTSKNGAWLSEKCDVSSWTNIVQIAASAYHTVGLRDDGTVVAVVSGRDSGGVADVSSWTNIVQIAASGGHTAGLRTDGTVVMTNDCWGWTEQINSWTDIVEVSVSDSHVLGLKANGTVVVACNNSLEYTDVDGWQDIISIRAGYMVSMGLKADGTVVVVGDNYGFEYNSGAINNTWNNICACETKVNFVGLKSDGSMVQVLKSDNDFYHPGLELWSDIVYFSKGLHIIVGVKSNGTILVLGTNTNSFEGDISVLKDIRPVDVIY